MYSSYIILAVCRYGHSYANYTRGFSSTILLHVVFFFFLMGICTREYYTIHEWMGPRSVLSGRDLYIIYVAGHPKNYKDVRMRHAKGGMRMHFYKIVHFFITSKITKKNSSENTCMEFYFYETSMLQMRLASLFRVPLCQ